MQTLYAIRIAGLGRCLPARVVGNDEVEALCGVRPGTIARTEAGVAERRWASGAETNASLGAAAAREAVAEAGLELGDIDLILNASGTQQQVVPDGAALVQRELGLGNSGVACMSVHTTCLGFLNGLDVAGALLEAARYRNILLVNADITSVGINPAEAESAALLGDAAAAAVIRAADPDEGVGIEAIRFQTFGDAAHLTEVRGGGTLRHPNDPTTRPEDNLFHMEGLQVFAFASRRVLKFFRGFNADLGQDVFQRVDWVVPHQPSLKGLRVLEHLGAAPERIVTTIEKLGNCGSASMPCTLYEGVRDGRIQRGHRVLLAGTGAGLSIGAAVLRY